MPRAGKGEWPRGENRPVLVIPGFGQSARGTQRLRDVLNAQDFAAQDWGLGRNAGLKSGMTSHLLALLKDMQHSSGEAAAIVGWSLGGVFARELARKDPDLVSHVISLGSPLAGGHSTTLQTLLGLINPKTRGGSSHDPKRYAPPPVPCTAIYSRSDGIVNWRASLEPEAENTENIEVRGSHLGLGFNPAVWHIICHRLSPQTRHAPYTR